MILKSGPGSPMPSAMAYQYEVFLSYRRIHIVQDWLGPFLSHFSDWLAEALAEQGYLFPSGHPIARICRDDDVVLAGSLWPQMLRDAARDSRCAVAIITPTYFYSEACRVEFQTFRKRGPGLVIPIRFHDCDKDFQDPSFPVAFDLSDFTSAVQGSRRRARFHDRIKELATHVAKAVVAAPEYPTDGQFPECWLTDTPTPADQPPPVVLRSL